HGVEHERGPRLRPQRFGIRRGQESGGEESIAQPDARGVFAFPEWRRITGCLGLFLTLVEQLDEVSQQLPVLPVCLASRSLQLPLERGEMLRPQRPPDEVIRHRLQWEVFGRDHDISTTFATARDRIIRAYGEWDARIAF